VTPYWALLVINNVVWVGRWVGRWVTCLKGRFWFWLVTAKSELGLIFKTGTRLGTRFPFHWGMVKNYSTLVSDQCFYFW
jgi:hypothetical protein